MDYKTNTDTGDYVIHYDNGTTVYVKVVDDSTDDRLAMPCIPRHADWDDDPWLEPFTPAPEYKPEYRPWELTPSIVPSTKGRPEQQASGYG
jgi:hypothetical protein